MICKSAEYQNGYIFTPSSTDEDFQKILEQYPKVNCIICNENTIRNFRQPYGSKPGITMNKKLADGVFFINCIK
jgi:hypothetical protein